MLLVRRAVGVIAPVHLEHWQEGFAVGCAGFDSMVWMGWEERSVSIYVNGC